MPKMFFLVDAYSTLIRMQIGDRVTVGEKRAIVRYLGTIDGHPGEWVGLEYDDPNGGKHDGVVAGKRYFQAKHPMSASFMKRHLVDPGCDLVSAIEDRYSDRVDKYMMEENCILTGTKHIELVGMEKTAKKQRDIYILTTIVLDSRNVSKPPLKGTPSFSRCRELNLYNNLLHRWDDVEEILTYFPVLEEIVLRRNMMDAVPPSTKVQPWRCSEKLCDVILSDCGVSSETISYALGCIYSATNLYALRNQISRFVVPVEMASRLQILDLEGNPLCSFKNVEGVYSNLHKLSLVKCDLTAIELHNENRFPLLQHLNLLENEITKWSSIQNLRCLPSLSVLFINSKLFTTESDIAAHEVITSLLPSLRDLNRFDINATERRSAEIRFINKYGVLPEEKRRPFQEEIDRIVKIYGSPAVDNSKKGVRLIKLTISYDEKRVEKSLPLEITVQKLSELLCRVFRVSSLHARLFLDKNINYSVELDNPSRCFNHYSPETTDVLRIVAA